MWYKDSVVSPPDFNILGVNKRAKIARFGVKINVFLSRNIT